MLSQIGSTRGKTVTDGPRKVKMKVLQITLRRAGLKV